MIRNIIADIIVSRIIKRMLGNDVIRISLNTVVDIDNLLADRNRIVYDLICK